VRELFVETTGTVSAATTTAASTTSYKILVGATPGTPADSGFSGTKPTAYNYADTAIASGTWCVLTWINNHWVITPLACAAHAT
jgi:hypothetical protein